MAAMDSRPTVGGTLKGPPMHHACALEPEVFDHHDDNEITVFSRKDVVWFSERIGNGSIGPCIFMLKLDGNGLLLDENFLSQCFLSS